MTIIFTFLSYVFYNFEVMHNDTIIT